jgi:sporulation protein YlmC with PRC-barrel domain
MIHVSDLCRKHVRRENGESLGRVFEIHIEGSQVTALTCGARGFLQRLTAAHSGHRVLWAEVLRIDSKEIVVANRRS